MNYEFNLLHHVGVVARRVCAAAETAHEGDDNTPLSPTVRGVKTIYGLHGLYKSVLALQPFQP